MVGPISSSRTCRLSPTTDMPGQPLRAGGGLRALPPGEHARNRLALDDLHIGRVDRGVYRVFVDHSLDAIAAHMAVTKEGIHTDEPVTDDHVLPSSSSDSIDLECRRLVPAHWIARVCDVGRFGSH